MPQIPVACFCEPFGGQQLPEGFLIVVIAVANMVGPGHTWGGDVAQVNASAEQVANSAKDLTKVAEDLKKHINPFRV